MTTPATSNLTPQPPLGVLMPEPLVAEYHQQLVHAPADLTWQAAWRLPLSELWVMQALVRLRAWGLRLAHRGDQPTAPPLRHVALVPQMREIGWGDLAEQPGTWIALGAVTRPWEAQPTFRALPPDQFAAFAEPGWIKIVWTLEATAVSAACSLAVTRTWVSATDDASRRRFLRYWRAVSPGVVLIRLAALRAIRRDAERAWRDAPARAA